jgi:hypothetical protein
VRNSRVRRRGQAFDVSGSGINTGAGATRLPYFTRYFVPDSKGPLFPISCNAQGLGAIEGFAWVLIRWQKKARLLHNYDELKWSSS